MKPPDQRSRSRALADPSDLLWNPEGRIVNGLDHLWTLEECRAEIEIEKILDVRADDSEESFSLEALHALGKSWFRWSVGRLEKEQPTSSA